MIQQRTVDRYAKANALEKRYHKEVEGLKEELKKALLGGSKCPDRGPFLVEIETVPKADFSWKDIAEELAEQVKAQKILERIVKSKGKRNEKHLKLVANPRWKTKRRGQ